MIINLLHTAEYLIYLCCHHKYPQVYSTSQGNKYPFKLNFYWKCKWEFICWCIVPCAFCHCDPQGLNNIIHIDFDYRKEFIYWVDSTRPSGRKINRMRLNGSDLKVPQGLLSPASPYAALCHFTQESLACYFLTPSPACTNPSSLSRGSCCHQTAVSCFFQLL